MAGGIRYTNHPTSPSHYVYPIGRYVDALQERFGMIDAVLTQTLDIPAPKASDADRTRLARIQGVSPVRELNRANECTLHALRFSLLFGHPLFEAVPTYIVEFGTSRNDQNPLTLIVQYLSRDTAMYGAGTRIAGSPDVTLASGLKMETADVVLPHPVDLGMNSAQVCMRLIQYDEQARKYQFHPNIGIRSSTKYLEKPAVDELIRRKVIQNSPWIELTDNFSHLGTKNPYTEARHQERYGWLMKTHTGFHNNGRSPTGTYIPIACGVPDLVKNDHVRNLRYRFGRFWGQPIYRATKYVESRQDVRGIYDAANLHNGLRRWERFHNAYASSRLEGRRRVFIETAQGLTVPAHRCVVKQEGMDDDIYWAIDVVADNHNKRYTPLYRPQTRTKPVLDTPYSEGVVVASIRLGENLDQEMFFYEFGIGVPNGLDRREILSQWTIPWTSSPGVRTTPVGSSPAIGNQDAPLVFEPQSFIGRFLTREEYFDVGADVLRSGEKYPNEPYRFDGDAYLCKTKHFGLETYVVLSPTVIHPRLETAGHQVVRYDRYRRHHKVSVAQFAYQPGYRDTIRRSGAPHQNGVRYACGGMDEPTIIRRLWSGSLSPVLDYETGVNLRQIRVSDLTTEYTLQIPLLYADNEKGVDQQFFAPGRIPYGRIAVGVSKRTGVQQIYRYTEEGWRWSYMNYVPAITENSTYRWRLNHQMYTLTDSMLKLPDGDNPPAEVTEREIPVYDRIQQATVDPWKKTYNPDIIHSFSRDKVSPYFARYQILDNHRNRVIPSVIENNRFWENVEEIWETADYQRDSPTDRTAGVPLSFRQVLYIDTWDKTQYINANEAERKKRAAAIDQHQGMLMFIHLGTNLNYLVTWAGVFSNNPYNFWRMDENARSVHHPRTMISYNYFLAVDVNLQTKEFTVLNPARNPPKLYTDDEVNRFIQVFDAVLTPSIPLKKSDRRNTYVSMAQQPYPNISHVGYFRDARRQGIWTMATESAGVESMTVDIDKIKTMNRTLPANQRLPESRVAYSWMDDGLYPIIDHNYDSPRWMLRSNHMDAKLPSIITMSPQTSKIIRVHHGYILQTTEQQDLAEHIDRNTVTSEEVIASVTLADKTRMTDNIDIIDFSPQQTKGESGVLHHLLIDKPDSNWPWYGLGYSCIPFQIDFNRMVLGTKWTASDAERMIKAGPDYPSIWRKYGSTYEDALRSLLMGDFGIGWGKNVNTCRRTVLTPPTHTARQGVLDPAITSTSSIDTGWQGAKVAFTTVRSKPWEQLKQTHTAQQFLDLFPTWKSAVPTFHVSTPRNVFPTTRITHIFQGGFLAIRADQIHQQGDQLKFPSGIAGLLKTNPDTNTILQRYLPGVRFLNGTRNHLPVSVPSDLFRETEQGSSAYWSRPTPNHRLDTREGFRTITNPSDITLDGLTAVIPDGSKLILTGAIVKHLMVSRAKVKQDAERRQISLTEWTTLHRCFGVITNLKTNNSKIRIELPPDFDNLNEMNFDGLQKYRFAIRSFFHVIGRYNYIEVVFPNRRINMGLAHTGLLNPPYYNTTDDSKRYRDTKYGYDGMFLCSSEIGENYFSLIFQEQSHVALFLDCQQMPTRASVTNRPNDGAIGGVYSEVVPSTLVLQSVYPEDNLVNRFHLYNKERGFEHYYQGGMQEIAPGVTRWDTTAAERAIYAAARDLCEPLTTLQPWSLYLTRVQESPGLQRTHITASGPVRVSEVKTTETYSR